VNCKKEIIKKERERLVVSKTFSKLNVLNHELKREKIKKYENLKVSKENPSTRMTLILMKI